MRCLQNTPAVPPWASLLPRRHRPSATWMSRTCSSTTSSHNTVCFTPHPDFTTQSFDYPSPPPPSLPWCIHKKTVPTNTFIKSPLPGPHAEDEARSPTSKSRRTNGGESTSAPAPPAANKSSWFHLVFLKSASQHTTPQTTHTTLLLLPTQYASPYSDIFYFLTTTIDLFSFRSTTNSSSNGYREHIDGGNKKAHWGTAGKTK